ncbi:hypothetical protein SAMN05443574_104179 [Haloarcula vallismortis]|uniref:Uncharacterized protein n=2 Tax=Haloarcula vallismortis TaxID=28442 RepID=M0J208_HALVA|nr:hypothetical protein [Haloarcula vallismortis]EMA01770.1 hypothetical protein C437_15161 [Haloarcula vallismortis ATCC 29715]SDW54207.1 hypothetical protein SAMN05443574_104179 [Haloarcula vallismortis]
MLHSQAGRVAAICGLLAILFALMIGLGTATPAPELGDYPDGDALAQHPANHIGESVQVTGSVTGTEPVEIAVEYEYAASGEYHSGTLMITVRNVDTAVAEGESLQVYGTFGPDRTITAENSVRVPAVNYTAMYVVSALAGLWTLCRLVCGWRLNWQTGALCRREKPLRPIQALRTRVQEVRA